MTSPDPFFAVWIKTTQGSIYRIPDVTEQQLSLFLEGLNSSDRSDLVTLANLSQSTLVLRVAIIKEVGMVGTEDVWRSPHA